MYIQVNLVLVISLVQSCDVVQLVQCVLPQLLFV